jgi:hypothetical protein
MATVVLQYAGSAVGGLVGGPLGMMLGRAAGALVGSAIDGRLFGQGARSVAGPRLDDLRIMSSSEGAPIPVAWGRVRLSGQVIWATELEEEITTTEQNSGAKGSDATTEATEYLYFANFAVGLCQGEISSLGRVWADGKPVDLSRVAFRLYTGSETQAPDSLIVAHEGQGNAPAYRGLAYVVFERLPVAKYGNRIPQLSFEVIRKVGALEDSIRSVALIPGATEFGYDPLPVTRRLDKATAIAENTHAATAESDWSQSIDELQDLCPNLEAVSLTVAWFGNDLRCADCSIEPRVESSSKNTRPESWSVAGLSRNAARPVSTMPDGSAAYGGTPSDAGVVRAIADLKRRGLKVTFCPFVMMDIPAANGLPDPYSSLTAQPAYPWRGRITCSPAPGMPDTPDKTDAVIDQVGVFFGSAAPQDFRLASGSVTYSGPSEWSFRRFVLHCAALCQLAGGVDAFMIGSELPGITRLRSSENHFPAVAQLVALAADVKSMLSSAKISYGADWSEYFGYRPMDGTGDVFFNLDPLWSSADVDFIGIDNYFPLSDWRDGAAHLDRLRGHRSPSSLEYLQANIEGGEGYDWYYPSEVHREAQDRVAIADGSYGKPWVYRCKDLKNWWLNLHYDRPGGVESQAPTAWVPQSKPIWFTEIGCPAVDKGSNQPNVFYDPKSSQSALPYHSNGERDDFSQRQYLQAVHSYWSETTARNPVSSVYGAPMVDAGRMFIWAWDARPFPAFPALSDVWADSANHERGHWLNGRLGGAPLSNLIGAILDYFGFHDAEIGDLQVIIDGYVIDNVMSARDAIEPLAQAFGFDVRESEGKLRFIDRRGIDFMTLDPEDCIEIDAQKPLYTFQRMQETELPASIRLTYIDSGREYRQSAVESRRSSGSSRREKLLALPAMLSQAAAQAAADRMLFDAWSAREEASFALPPSLLRVEPGDGIALRQDQNFLPLRIEEISESYSRVLKARQISAEIYEPLSSPSRSLQATVPPTFAEPVAMIMDLPLLTASAESHALWVAACSNPWTSLSVYRKTGGSFQFNRSVPRPAIIGETLDPLPSGPLWRRTRQTAFRVRLFRGALQSIGTDEVLNGGNLAAVGDVSTGFEIIQFEQAALVDPSTYEISILLRGQLGSSPEMLPLREAGSSFIMLDSSLVQLSMTAADVGLDITWRIGPASRSHGDDAYREETTVPLARALRPLPPCQLRARRAVGGVEFSWIRQTRLDGDNWELADVPLAEAAERYELEFLEGDVVKRSLILDQPNHFYADADQLADFGSTPSSFDIRVSQLSAVYGSGAATKATLHV